MSQYEDILERQIASLRDVAAKCLILETFDELNPDEDPQDFAASVGEQFEDTISVLSALFFGTSDTVSAAHDQSRADYVDALKPGILQGKGGWTLRWAVVAPRFKTMHACLQAAEARQSHR